MKKYKGIIASPGLAMAKAYRFKSRLREIPKFRISQQNVEHEKKRFSSSIEKSEREISTLMKASKGKHPTDIIESYLMMIQDEDFHQKVHDNIQENFYNAEWAIYEVMQKYITLLEYSEQKYLQEREYDLNEIIVILISHLTGFDNRSYEITESSIVVSRELYSSDFLKMPREHIAGIITERGSTNSHTSIIAKSYGIPMLVGIPIAGNQVQTGDEIILDADKGFLYTDIDAELKSKFEQNYRHAKQEEQEIMRQAGISEHKTIDNVEVSVKLNFDLLEEMDEKTIALSDGVGLFRTEFLFPITTSYFNEEQQLQMYMKVVSALKGKPVAIRTFDVGGDKTREYIQSLYEENPLIGFRGIRFSLAHKEILLSQLRSILKASHYGEIRILVPMISTFNEWEEFLELLEKAKTQLQQEGIEFDANIKVGPMIEVPSILYMLEDFAPYSDFWSVGTNDLLQFIMASDRTNSRVEYLYQNLQPAFLRLLRDLFHSSYELGIEVSICGEMASDVKTLPLLLGAGLRNFSVSSSRLPHVIAQISNTRVDLARQLFEDVAQLTHTEKVLQKVEDFLSENLHF